jgi:hypothetical protein
MTLRSGSGLISANGEQTMLPSQQYTCRMQLNANAKQHKLPGSGVAALNWIDVRA